MSKNTIIIILAVVVIVIGGYFIFTNQSLAPATTSAPVAYTDAPSFSRSFLQCSPSELRMPFTGTDTIVITVFGIENGKCHYLAGKILDKNGAVVQSGVDCKVPEELITNDVFGHFFGQDKSPGQEKVLAAQNKIEADYCTK